MTTVLTYKEGDASSTSVALMFAWPPPCEHNENVQSKPSHSSFTKALPLALEAGCVHPDVDVES